MGFGLLELVMKFQEKRFSGAPAQISEQYKLLSPFMFRIFCLDDEHKRNCSCSLVTCGTFVKRAVW